MVAEWIFVIHSVCSAEDKFQLRINKKRPPVSYKQETGGLFLIVGATSDDVCGRGGWICFGISSFFYRRIVSSLCFLVDVGVCRYCGFGL